MRVSPSSATASAPSKVQHVCSQLRSMARERGPHAKMPTVAHLRAQFGVSLGTLDVALAQMEANNVLVRRQGSGIYVSPHLQYHFALVCDPGFFSADQQSPFWNMLLRCIEERAERGHETVEIHFVQTGGLLKSQHEARLTKLIQQGIDGVIGIGLKRHATDWFEEHQVPYVGLFGPGKYMVMPSEAALIAQGVAALFERGCRRLGLWTLSEDSLPHELGQWHSNTALFQQALSEFGLPFYPAWSRAPRVLKTSGLGKTSGLDYRQQGEEAAQEVFGYPRAEWPDGIVSCNDILTQGALQVMASQGIEVPRDVLIATHANQGSQALTAYEGQLIHLSYDPREFVEQTFALLERQITGAAPPVPQSLFLPPQTAVTLRE